MQNDVNYPPSSQYGHRCRITPTNAVLSDSEAHSIRNQLSEVEIELTYLNEQITAAAAVLHKLVDQRTQLTTEITEYRISLAPHKKLPPELLGKIFQYCVPDKTCLPPGLYDSPLLLCQVCRSWREVALGTPTFWNRIAVEFKSSRRVRPINLLDMAKIWLSRSGVTIPLSIALDVDHAHDDGGLGMSSVQALIRPYIHRCREITLRLPTISFRPFLQLSGGSAEILEVLDLQCIDRVDLDRSWSDIIDVFVSANRLLHSVTFTRTNDMFRGPQLLRLPYSHLTHLRIVDTWINPDTCHAMLRQCTNLVNCSMVALPCHGFEQVLDELDPTVLPNLQQLRLHPFFTTFDDSYAPFLRPLVLPALKDFELTSTQSWSETAFKSLCSRSSFDLERFAILKVHPRDGLDLQTLLQDMPSLVELDVRSRLDDSTLDMICKGDLIPKLEVINLSNVSSNAAFDVIQSRWNLDANLATRRNCRGVPISRLREAVVSRKCNRLAHVNNSFRARFETFRQEGLLVHYQ